MKTPKISKEAMDEPKEKFLLRIKNFKNLEDVSLSIRPTTILLGPNGSGKSSILKALLFLRENLFRESDKINKTKYQLTKNIDLGSFKEIVNKNDTTKNIEFDLEIEHYRHVSEEQVKHLQGIFFVPYNRPRKDFDDMLLSRADEQYLSMEDKQYLTESAFSSGSMATGRATTRINPVGSQLKAVAVHHAQSDFEQERVKLHVKYGTGLNEDNFIGYKIMDLRSECWIEYLYSVETQKFKINSKLSDNRSLNKLWNKYLRKKKFLPFMHYDKMTGVSSSEIISFRSKSDHLISFLRKEFVRKHIKQGKKIEKDIYRLLENIELFYNIYPELIHEQLMGPHFPMIRDVPLHNYLLGNGKFSKYDYYEIPAKMSEGPTVWDNDTELSHWMAKLSIGTKLEIQNRSITGSIDLKTMNGSTINLAETCSGSLQLLPIVFGLIDFFKKENFDLEGETDPEEIRLSKINAITRTGLIYAEQPELHLHPSMQVKLVELFSNVKKANVLIETHSEHLIRGFQILVAEGKIKSDDIAIYYFSDSDNGSVPLKMDLDERGLFKQEWPEGFFDESFKQMKQLIFAEKQ
jgi:predicted ATPase